MKKQTSKNRLVGAIALMLLVVGLWLASSRLGHSEPTAQAAPASAGDSANIQLGLNQSLQGRQIFTADDEWNRDVSKEPTDPTSDAIIAGIGLDRPLHPDFGGNYQGGPFGIPYIVIAGSQPRVPVKFGYADQSDPGPYPIPADAPIEGGPKSTGDRHVLVVDKDNWMLYELDEAYLEADGKSWRADSGAVFDLGRNSIQRRPGWTSADAAGLPIFPGLVRYDEAVEQKEIKHAIRFTVQHSRHAFILPATHFAAKATDENLPPMGMRVRLKQDFDINGFPPTAKVILQAMKKYGLILADNGSNWFISGTADPRWNDAELNALKQVKGSNFEVVRMGQIFTRVD